MKHRTKSTSHRSKKPLSKDLLLPLPADVARKKSLEHHLALASLQSGNGSTDAIGKLFHALYVAYYVHVATIGYLDLDQFRTAEVALHDGAAIWKETGNFDIPEGSRVAIECVLLLYDQQLADQPAHRFSSAADKLARFLTTPDISPIVTG
ncbi:hypothetical protein WT26_25475 [Burkholderia cepacia]|uniref:Fis family transcriptional regulator n=1 Tax=Burkholderia cepacia TaxID=292 RepID=A0A1B4PZF2_BURCE|nr:MULTISPECIES: hypothetical protein [Burkholderia cepacia complex]AOK19285.1 hypothetical protein WT26_25475 [Burkholderia cepacia]